MFEWTPIQETEQDNEFDMASIIDLVFEYQVEVRDLVYRYLSRNVILETWEGNLPLYNRINRIERNLMLLVGNAVFGGMQSTVNWLGWLKDIRRLDYTDVNRWFETIKLLNDVIETFKRPYMVTGTFTTGNHLIYQMIGLGMYGEVVPPTPPVSGNIVVVNVTGMHVTMETPIIHRMRGIY